MKLPPNQSTKWSTRTRAITRAVGKGHLHSAIEEGVKLLEKGRGSQVVAGVVHVGYQPRKPVYPVVVENGVDWCGLHDCTPPTLQRQTAQYKQQVAEAGRYVVVDVAIVGQRDLFLDGRVDAADPVTTDNPIGLLALETVEEALSGRIIAADGPIHLNGGC